MMSSIITVPVSPISTADCVSVYGVVDQDEKIPQCSLVFKKSGTNVFKKRRTTQTAYKVTSRSDRTSLTAENFMGVSRSPGTKNGDDCYVSCVTKGMATVMAPLHDIKNLQIGDYVKAKRGNHTVYGLDHKETISIEKCSPNELFSLAIGVVIDKKPEGLGGNEVVLLVGH